MAGPPAQSNNAATNLPERDLELLSVYLDNELSEQERRLLEQRLRSEPALRAELDELQATVMALREMPPVPLPRSFTLDPATVRPHGFWARLGGLRLAGAAVAMVLLLVVSVVVVGWPGGQMAQQSPEVFEQTDAGLSTADSDRGMAEIAETATQEPMVAAQLEERAEDAPVEEAAKEEAAPAEEMTAAESEMDADTEAGGMVREGASEMVPAEPPAPMRQPGAAGSNAAGDGAPPDAALATMPPPSPTVAKVLRYEESESPTVRVGGAGAMSAVEQTAPADAAGGESAVVSGGGRSGALVVVAGVVLMLIGVGAGVWVYLQVRRG